MGYEVRIVRNEEWWDEEIGGGISLAEWKSLVAHDDTMRMDGFTEIDLPNGSTLRMENEGIAVWTEYRGNEVGGNQAWFDFRDKAVVTKNPDQEILAKMLDISSRLNAKVIGDDGEEYTTSSDHGMPTRESMQVIVSDQRKPWWKFW